MKMDGQCQKLFILLCHMLSTMTTEDSNIEISKQLDVEFPQNVRDLILTSLNNLPVEKLSKFKSLSEQRVRKIITYREEQGKFESLNELLHIKGIGFKSALSLCNAILNEKSNSTAEIRKISKGNIYTPSLPFEQLQLVQSMVALQINFNCIAWLHFSAKKQTVIAWDIIPLGLLHPAKHSLIDYFEKVSDVVVYLPKADIYLIEDFVKFSSSNQFSLNCILQVIASVLISILNKDFSLSNSHKVLLIKSLSVARYFGLIIGKERISGQKIINASINKDNFFPNIGNYEALSSVDKDVINNCILLAITFCELVLGSSKVKSRDNE